MAIAQIPELIGCARRPPQQLRQLGDVEGDPPRLVAGQAVHRYPAAGLVLETSECVRRPVKQFELSGQRRDT
jgi:hypothetical protein